MQNIYDDPEFFAGYAELRRTESGWNAAVEQPALQSVLPPSLQGISILDLGCGFGDFARLAVRLGAERVTAIDISERMLAAARAATDDERITYIRSAIETFNPGAEAFDLVVSSLALHYVEDYGSVVRMVARALRPNGRFAFSVEHPVATAYGTYEWQRDDKGSKLHWKLDRYREEGLRESTWFVPGVLKYHRTSETYVNALLDAGLTLRRLCEPEATAEAMKARPDLIDTRRRPAFLVLAADRASSGRNELAVAGGIVT